MEWKYVRPLKDPELVDQFERKARYFLPEEYRQCVEKHNGGRPSRKIFDTDQEKERVVKMLLSLNREDPETVWPSLERLQKETGGRYVPFADDDFGNLICFDRGTDEVVFRDHETGSVELIAPTFSDFLKGLRAEEP